MWTFSLINYDCLVTGPSANGCDYDFYLPIIEGLINQSDHESLGLLNIHSMLIWLGIDSGMSMHVANVLAKIFKLKT